MRTSFISPVPVRLIHAWIYSVGVRARGDVDTPGQVRTTHTAWTTCGPTCAPPRPCARRDARSLEGREHARARGAYWPTRRHPLARLERGTRCLCWYRRDGAAGSPPHPHSRSRKITPRRGSRALLRALPSRARVPDASFIFIRCMDLSPPFLPHPHQSRRARAFEPLGPGGALAHTHTSHNHP